MGEGLARIHVAAASYRGPASAEQLDLEHLVARPLRRIAALPHVGSDVHEKLAALGAELVQRISAIDGLARVACHGDCHGANTLVHDAPDGTRAASFFDFDDGGPGWLAYDLCVYLWAQLVHGAKMNEGGGERWRALVEGYRRVAPIAELDYDAIAAFVSARHFWFLGEYATRLDEWGATSLSEAWLREQVDQLASWRALTTPPSASP